LIESKCLSGEECDPMRCEDLTRELASPTGHLSRAEMAGHLAHCPSCAEWSRRAAHLDRIWEATRPSEPNEATLDALWAGASVAIDARSVPSPLRLEGLTHRRRGWMKPTIMVAQAAAILIAAVVLFRQATVKPVEIADATPVEKTVEPVKDVVRPPLNLNVEIGEMAVVTIGDSGHKIEVQNDLSPDSSRLEDLTSFDVSRGVEGMERLGLGSMASR
jgi:hypothetical protein